MGILDSLSNASVAAWSLRKLRSAYAGYACRIQRSSDNATQDIGFSGTDFDTTSAASFVGASNAVVAIWYDQSGNGYNLTPSGTGPTLYTSGTLKTAGTNSKASPSFSSNQMVTGFSVTMSDPYNMTVAGLMNATSLSGYPRFFSLGASGDTDYQTTKGGILSSGGSNLIWQSTYYSLGPSSFATGALKNIGIVHKSLEGDVYVNSSATLNGVAFPSGANTGMALGGSYSGGGQCTALIPEWVVFNAILSSTDRNAIFSDQQTYYGTS